LNQVDCSLIQSNIKKSIESEFYMMIAID